MTALKAAGLTLSRSRVGALVKQADAEDQIRNGPAVTPERRRAAAQAWKHATLADQRRRVLVDVVGKLEPGDIAAALLDGGNVGRGHAAVLLSALAIYASRVRITEDEE